jgi:hypothetical protein
MKEHFHIWLTEKMKVAGVLACGMRAPDHKTFARSSSSQFSSMALEHACRCLADTFQILHSNRFPGELIRWVYANYFVYSSIRQDGICLVVLTRREGANLQSTELEKMLTEFQNLQT